MRPFRIIGIFLLTAAVSLTLNWFLNTLMPLNRLNGLQPARADALGATTQATALVECHMSRNWDVNSRSNLLLSCDGQDIRVNKTAHDVKNLPFEANQSGRVKAIAPSDPIIVVGKRSTNPTSLVEAELVAYGNRDTNLSTFQANGIFQIICAEVLGGLGILLLFLDWRMARAKRAQRILQEWQTEKTYVAKPAYIEQPAYQRRH